MWLKHKRKPEPRFRILRKPSQDECFHVEALVGNWAGGNSWVGSDKFDTQKEAENFVARKSQPNIIVREYY